MTHTVFFVIENYVRKKCGFWEMQPGICVAAAFYGNGLHLEQKIALFLLYDIIMLRRHYNCKEVLQER